MILGNGLMVRERKLILLPDPYTKVLLHFNGTDASTTITDESGKTWTAVGTAQLDTAQKVFGTASLLLDGDSDLITTPNSTDLNLNGVDFTIDAKIRFSFVGSTVQTIAAHWDISTTQREWLFFWRGSDASLAFQYSPDGTNFTVKAVTWSPSADTWYHVAVVKNGNDLYFFVDGEQVGDTQDVTGATFYASTALGTIGGYKGASAYIGYFYGWIDEFRLSKGIARWTADFTPPASAYTMYL